MEKALVIIHTLLNNESPEIICYCQHLKHLATPMEKRLGEVPAHTLHWALPHESQTFGIAQSHTTDPDRASKQRETLFLQIRKKDIILGKGERHHKDSGTKLGGNLQYWLTCLLFCPFFGESGQKSKPQNELINRET